MKLVNPYSIIKEKKKKVSISLDAKFSSLFLFDTLNGNEKFNDGLVKKSGKNFYSKEYFSC